MEEQTSAQIGHSFPLYAIAVLGYIEVVGAYFYKYYKNALLHCFD